MPLAGALEQAGVSKCATSLQQVSTAAPQPGIFLIGVASVRHNSQIITIKRY